jgi:hypothetical protein
VSPKCSKTHVRAFVVRKIFLGSLALAIKEREGEGRGGGEEGGVGRRGGRGKGGGPHDLGNRSTPMGRGERREGRGREGRAGRGTPTSFFIIPSTTPWPELTAPAAAWFNCMNILGCKYVAAVISCVNLYFFLYIVSRKIKFQSATKRRSDIEIFFFKNYQVSFGRSS